MADFADRIVREVGGDVYAVKLRSDGGAVAGYFKVLPGEAVQTVTLFCQVPQWADRDLSVGRRADRQPLGLEDRSRVVSGDLFAGV